MANNYNSDAQHKFSRTLLKPSLVALAISSCFATGAMAQETATEADAEIKLERIEVTARRTIENLQTVPVAVTSLGEEELAQRGMDNITAVAQFSPNTTLQVSRGTNSTLTAYIRGIGQQDPLWGFEPGVGIYIDDVYMARPQGAALDVYDVERIEVLRGPQGTLYGRNTIGGAVKYVTKQLTGDNEFAVRGTVGTKNQRDLKISGQTGLTDNVFISGAFATFNRDGFGKFLNTGDDNYNKELMTGRVSLQWNVTDSFSMLLNADKTVDDSNPRGGFRLFPSALAPTDAVPGSVYDANISMPVTNKVETEGQSITMTLDLSDNWTLKSVTARREGVTDTHIDFDSTSFPTLDIPAFYEDTQVSQELQLLYSDDKLKVASGLYYYDGEACGAFGQVVYGLSTTENGGCVQTDSIAAYAQGTYQLDDKWSLTFGGRYTKDDKDANVYRYVYAGYKFPRDTDGVYLSTQTEFSGSESFSHFSPRVGAEYQYSRDLMLYGSYTNGFKSGGFDMRANQAINPDADEPYQEETVDTYELGMKSEWFNQRLRLNAAVFMSSYDDMQVTVQRSVETAPGVVTVASQVLNAASADINGVELEAQFAVSRNFDVSMIVGYVDASFNKVEFFDPNQQQVVDVSDVWAFANTPELTATLAGKYSIATEIGEFVITANMAHRSETQIFEVPSVLDYGGYTVFNAGVNWYSNDGHWDVSLQGKNLGDKQARIAGYNFAGAVLDNSVLGFYIDPRTVSLSVGYRF
ncbi:iron complex outermembrane recepter protein [Rheinheimera pacifica]|uniref:Iron complex outermembrane recepter protein n=1 Tax=Rheinheimera pacifica TaxID=173990 RepID=A0A1H6J6Y7_9GAMM|nr:TonB-dependent receptor [Rheinheimera pacifica]SEH57750.1 iron complex outermembrane recepter protein [Rheinheimera pacifica]